MGLCRPHRFAKIIPDPHRQDADETGSRNGCPTRTWLAFMEKIKGLLNFAFTSLHQASLGFTRLENAG